MSAARTDKGGKTWRPPPARRIMRSMRILSLFAASLIPALALAQPIETVVWSGAKPAGQTWAHLGPKGKFAVEDGAGEGGGKGLALHMDGEGYRGAGINWRGWYPPDSGNDTSAYTALV